MATITVRINDEEKNVLDQVVEEMGFNYSTFTAFIRRKFYEKDESLLKSLLVWIHSIQKAICVR